jgi:hypothetical protein
MGWGGAGTNDTKKEWYSLLFLVPCLGILRLVARAWPEQIRMDSQN